MKHTEKVSIGGYSFTMERDAYERLNGYIEDIRSTYAGNGYLNEILQDIEQRIAELFIEKCGKDGIVSYMAVDAIIHRMGSPSELADEEKMESCQDSRRLCGQEKTTAAGPKRLFRNTGKRVVGGVCSGMGAYFNIDPVLVRLTFVAITFLVSLSFTDKHLFSAALILAAMIMAGIYGLLCIIMPAAKTVEEKCRMNREPIGIGEFQAKFETGIKSAAKDISSSPAVHTAGRIISIILGTGLIISGVSGLIICSLYDLMSEATVNVLGSEPEELAIARFIQDPVLLWMAVATSALFSIWLIYNGILLAFEIKAPRWKPGTVLFIVWIVSMLAFSALVIRKLLLAGEYLF